LRALLARVTVAGEPLTEAGMDAWGTPVVFPHTPSVLRAGRLRALGERIAGRAALRGLRLRILVVSPLAGGSYPMAGHCARALAHLGHTVRLLDLSPFAKGMEAIPSFTPRRAARGAVEQAYMRFLGSGVLAAVEAEKPDLVLALAQAPLDAAVLAELGRRGAPRP